MAAVRTVVTLRARRMTGDPPRAGELMASATGKTVYRVLGVTTVRMAGDPLGTRYRLACGRLASSEVPEGATIHPWRWDRRAPRQTLAQARARSSAATPTPQNPQNASRPPPRPRTRGVEEATVADLGPVLRRRAVRDRAGRLLRDADVTVDDQAVDPRNPNRRIRRAYRVDPLDFMRRTGSIGPREIDAAAELRRHLEWIQPSLGAGGPLGVMVCAFMIQPIQDSHIRAARKLREASAALGEGLWQPVLWVCLGGTVHGYAMQWRCRQLTVCALVAEGMAKLADHFYGSAA